MKKLTKASFFLLAVLSLISWEKEELAKSSSQRDLDYKEKLDFTNYCGVYKIKIK